MFTNAPPQKGMRRHIPIERVAAWSMFASEADANVNGEAVEVGLRASPEAAFDEERRATLLKIVTDTQRVRQSVPIVGDAGPLIAAERIAQAGSVVELVIPSDPVEQ